MRTAPTASLLLAAALLAGCATRISGGVYTDEDGGWVAPVGNDLQPAPPPPDLARPLPPPDFSLPPPVLPDMADAGKSCGEIVQCMLGCGLMIGGCQLMCLQGGSANGRKEALGVVACAAQNCLAGGGGNLLLCVVSKCGTEVGSCEGFGLGGM